MIPFSLSATAISVANACLARYKAEHIDRGRGATGSAALEGSSAHGALELFVKSVYLDKTMEGSLDLLLEYYQLSYVQTMGNSDFTSDAYKAGVKMMKAWYARTDLSEVTVVSAEAKKFFLVPVKIDGKKEHIKFNYILDRFDQLDETIFKVVDYKTNAWPLSPGELRKKIQARCYALAMQIEHPDATEIWVEFDMLRHDGPVGVIYNREDNVATWKWIKAEAQRIIDTPDDKPLPETVNPECRFCVRKANCGALRRNIQVGGVLSLDLASMVDVRAELEFQKAAAQAAINEIDEHIVGVSKEMDLFEFESDDYTLGFSSSRRRAVDADRVFMVIGPDLARKYGGAKLSMKDFEELVKDPSLTEAQVKMLGSLVTFQTSEPRVSIKPKAAIS